jgi:hypothetical protein
MDIDWNRVMQDNLSSLIKDLFCYTMLFLVLIDF